MMYKFLSSNCDHHLQEEPLRVQNLNIVIVLFLSDHHIEIKSSFGSSALNPGAVFHRFFTVAFLLFLAPAGGSNPEANH